MLLKDKIKKAIEIKKENDKINTPIADGFVDIKSYDKDGNLIYHDCGDNVVTDWMRHVIMQLLTGTVFTTQGDMPNFDEKSENYNPDGYCFNNAQYFAEAANIVKNSISTKSDTPYSIAPTKVLFGTGKEYDSWSSLKTENEGTDWYDSMLTLYGNGDESEAETVFNANISREDNVLSSTLPNNKSSGQALLIKTRSVPNPAPSDEELASSVSMYKNYNVKGAIKTPYYADASASVMLQPSVSTSGKLLKPTYRGVGRPAFIYFNQKANNESPEGWGSNGEISLSKDEANEHLTKITYKITLPSQANELTSNNIFYPYNGYELRQIGLYNDARLMNNPTDLPSQGDPSYYPSMDMPLGMLLAIKNIAPTNKVYSGSTVITWTLSI